MDDWMFPGGNGSLPQWNSPSDVRKAELHGAKMTSFGMGSLAGKEGMAG